MRRSWMLNLLLAQLILISILLPGCSPAREGANSDKTNPSSTIVFADAEWESIKLHNRIAGYIVEHGYGYKVSYLAGEDLPLFKALSQGDVDVMMEIWTSDYPEEWENMLKSGKVKASGTNYTGIQGWFIPAYMVEGDAERGIEPQIPKFKSVQDLTVNQKIFQLSATSSKGSIYNAPQGWPSEKINNEKLYNYYLAEYFSLLPSDSEAALTSSLEKAYNRGDAWLGYARVPSLISAGHKLLLVREEPYSEEIWNLDRKCAYPECNVMIATNMTMDLKAPEILDFLQNYKSTREQNETMLLYLAKFEGSREKAAEEWLLSNPDVWSRWIPEEIAEKVWTDLNTIPAAKK